MERSFLNLSLKAFLIAAALIGSTVSAQAFQISSFKESPAQVEVVPADFNTSFRLIGRGLAAKNSNSSIALVCATSDCHQLRFLYILNDHQLFVGNRYDYVGEQELTEQELSEETKSILKSTKGIDNRDENRTGWFFLGGAAAGTTLLISHAFGIGFIIDALSFGGMIIAAMTGNPHKSLRALDFIGASKNTGTTAKVFYDRNGWNWSSKPKTVSYDHFLSYICGLVGAKGMTMIDFDRVSYPLYCDGGGANIHHIDLKTHAPSTQLTQE